MSEVPNSAASAPLPKMTVQEYFEFERTQEIRYEYVEGELIPMPGTSLEHSQIAFNIGFALELAFGDRLCPIFIESVRLRVSPTKYRYPDLMAVCETPITDGEKPPALLNPAIAVEILSSLTEYTDSTKKLAEYATVSSLKDYLMVAQGEPFVTHCVKQNERQWMVTQYSDLADTLTFDSLGVSLSLAQIYRKMTFAPEA